MLVVPSVWVFGIVLSGGFCIGLNPLFLCFREVLPVFRFFRGAILASFVFFFVGLCPLVINSKLSKKKKRGHQLETKST